MQSIRTEGEYIEVFGAGVMPVINTPVNEFVGTVPVLIMSFDRRGMSKRKLYMDLEPENIFAEARDYRGKKKVKTYA